MTWLIHSAKGTTWTKHKYIKKENGRYYYSDDVRRELERERLESELDKAIAETMMNQRSKKYKNLFPGTVLYNSNPFGKWTEPDEDLIKWNKKYHVYQNDWDQFAKDPKLYGRGIQKAVKKKNEIANLIEEQKAADKGRSIIDKAGLAVLNIPALARDVIQAGQIKIDELLY